VVGSASGAQAVVTSPRTSRRERRRYMVDLENGCQTALPRSPATLTA
jgi:hypothetical protein